MVVRCALLSWDKATQMYFCVAGYVLQVFCDESVFPFSRRLSR